MTEATNAPAPAYMARIRNQIRDAEAKADVSLMAKLDVHSLSDALRIAFAAGLGEAEAAASAA